MAQILAHQRLTAEDVRWQWLNGLLTPSGYVYNLIRAQRKDGWKFRIANVAAWCREHQIKRPTFYRAIAQLREANLLHFEVIGAIDLWIRPHDRAIEPIEPVENTDDPTCPNLDTRPQIWTPGLKSGHPASNLDREAPETQAPSEVEESYRSITDLSLSDPTAHPERDEDLNDRPIAPFDEIEFREWLRKRAQKLPRPPAFIEAWIEKAIKREGYKREFLQEKERRELAKNSAPVETPIFQNFPQPTPEEARAGAIARLTVKWQLYPNLRPQIEAELAALGAEAQEVEA
ncbi:hypothetical protein [Limnothrix sp. PR1529]|uniref:hypothetical protein n=1 Tax=Limnothrix sp. PR1529 TaxID=1704291 RepID=UPI0013040D75|nr:hypothetical protein [Limnothrix sp. PR1529]